MKYKKKPVTIEAIKIAEEGPSETPEWFIDAVKNKKLEILYNTFDEKCYIVGFKVQTLEGEMTGNAGDYLIRGVEGELYPCKGDIFEKTYEKVESSSKSFKSNYEHDLVDKYIDKNESIPSEELAKYICSSFPDSCFAHNYNGGWGNCWSDEEIYNEAKDMFRYEVLNWCGCGQPEVSDDIVFKYLDALSSDWETRKNKLEEYFGYKSIYDNPLMLCLAYTLDAAKFTDHGSSIGSEWLTNRGKIYHWILKQVDEMEEQDEKSDNAI